MLRIPALVLCAFFILGAQATHDDPVYAPLWLYQGTWHSTKTGTQDMDTLVDDCSLVGKFFACQQTLNGKIIAMIIFVPAEKPGFYHTQALTPEGFATGRGDLEIHGDNWTYSSKDKENGKTTCYRTTNAFTGRDKIHFEQSESTDGEHWKAVSSGDEVRVPSKK
jgi:hypothetical protein